MAQKNQSPTLMHPSNDESIKVKFLVTGFGPFAGVATNPSTILIQRLQHHCQMNPSLCITPKVLETSASYVKSYMGQFFHQIQQVRQLKLASIPNHIFIIHVGVSQAAKQIRLEQCAYNEATFRIPDEDGYQPNKVCIVENSGDYLYTQLDLKEFQKEQKECVSFSTDPGRFVCNFTYFYSLSQAKAYNDCTQTKTNLETMSNLTSESECSIDVLFVHVPPFAVINENRQFRFLLELINFLEKAIPQRNH